MKRLSASELVTRSRGARAVASELVTRSRVGCVAARSSMRDVGVVLAALSAMALLDGCTAKPAPEVAPPRVVEADAAAATMAGDAVATTRTSWPIDAAIAVDASGDGSSAGRAATSSVDAAAPTKVGGGPSAVASTAATSRAATKVVTIGMHVGGGPYDELTKEPMKRSVEPRFAELARCWTHVTSAPKPADAGVDLVIEAAGGRARVSNPRTQAQGEGFVACVVGFFESIDFEKPRNGKTVVSYSVRFTP